MRRRVCSLQCGVCRAADGAADAIREARGCSKMKANGLGQMRLGDAVPVKSPYANGRQR